MAAFISIGLVLIVTMLMAFIEYQGRLASFQPNIQSREITEQAEMLDQLDATVIRYKELRAQFDAAWRSLLDAQTQRFGRTDRVCSRYEGALQEECWIFLRSVPFDGALDIASASVNDGLSRTSHSRPPSSGSPNSPGFAATVLRNFVNHMEHAANRSAADGPARAGFGRPGGDQAYIGLFSDDIVQIARLNHRLITELMQKQDAARVQATSLCAQAAILASLIKDSRASDLDCGALSETAIPSSVSQAPPMVGAGAPPAATPPPATPVNATLPPATPPQGTPPPGTPVDAQRPSQGAVGAVSSSAVNANPDRMTDQHRFDLVNQLRNYNYISGGVARFLLLSPPDYLAAWLLVFGGAMGAMLKILFWHIMPARTIKWSDLFIEPAQGMVCAVLLFILFRSGLMVIAGAGPSSETSTLSPFFVAFVAIGAGLMSDQVILAASRAAGSLIGGASIRQTPRWAVGLAARLEPNAEGMAVHDLASRLVVSDDRVAAWSALRSPVEGEYQDKIALVLGVPPHLLFTDLNPRVAEREVPPAPSSGVAPQGAG
ncbi:hypothetical protein FHS55_003777 [Angulomicrobium tetraedrale]|uniref:Uncharacterized protein n=1 Tax=Ancylobacter tetraedralis TaxID=217068 RepID=A0A839ZER4_9HYPH|nr:hypothetical protein [Ancylobacter tetraedralis]MBB3773146.1 hypothetical protein [Ancylobacter tetraedralis]